MSFPFLLNHRFDSLSAGRATGSCFLKLHAPKAALLTICFGLLAACATVNPERAVRVAQPENGPVRNFTSFSPSLRCLDGMLAKAGRPGTLISSTGFPDLTKKVNIGADEMLVNAVNQMNRQSRAYVFIDQSLEKDWGQISLLTPKEENLTPRLYIRAAITQVDQGVLSDSGSLSLDFTNAPNPWNPFKADLKGSNLTAGRDASLISVDMHLVSFPDKTIVPGSSVANTMVVTTDSRGGQIDGLIRLTGFDFSIKITRVESLGQAVRNLVELGVIELLGRHARVPYWQCLNLRPSNQKLDNLDEARFTALSREARVTEIQKLLISTGYLSSPASGRLDQTTRAAISHFQADEKLIATGDVNYQLLVLLKEKALGFNRSRKPFPTPNKGPEPPALSLTPERQTYRKGDTLKLQLTANKDGFLRCFHQSGTGPIVQILPLAAGGLLRAKAGKTLPVPSRDAQFDIKFESRGAEEAVLCILTADRKLPDRKIVASAALQPLNVRSFGEIAQIYRRKQQLLATARFRSRAAR